MPLAFPQTYAHAEAGGRFAALLVARFTFPPPHPERRLWFGRGRIELNGEIWEGVGPFGGISSLSPGKDDEAREITFTLSGVDPQIMTIAMGEGDAVRGGVVRVYRQFFAEDGAPLDDFHTVLTCLMDHIRSSGDAKTRQVMLSCETLFADRSLPAAGMYTDLDQQARYPGDLAFEHVADMEQRRIKWPTL